MRQECVWRKVTEVKRWIAAERAAARAAEEAEACKGYIARKSIAEVHGVTVFKGKAKVERCPDGQDTIYITKGRHIMEITGITNDEATDAAWLKYPTGARIEIGPMKAKGACWVNDNAKFCTWK